LLKGVAKKFNVLDAVRKTNTLMARLRHPFCLPNCLVRSAPLVAMFLCSALAVGVISAKEKEKTKKSEKTTKAAARVPGFSVAGGFFTNAVTLQLSYGGDDALVRYTLNGSSPTEQSPAYSAGIVLTNSVTVRARVFGKGYPPGPMAVESYVFLESDMLDFKSNLPLILLHAGNREVSKDEKSNVAARVLDTRNGLASVANRPEYAGQALLNLRGRASLRYPKRSYTLKLVDAEGDPLKTSLLGLPKDADWVLYAPFPDKTLMRDALAYELSNAIGRWAPRTRYVELFVNESGGPISRRDYLGVYVLEERIKIGKHRIDVEELSPGDVSPAALSGGYVFKKDHGDNGDNAPMNAGGYPAFTAMNSSRTGFPTGPGAFPGEPAGFQPPSKSSSRSSSSSSSSSRSRISAKGSVTNHIGAPIRREPMGVMRSVIYRGDDEEIVEMMEDEGMRASFRTVRTNKFYFVEPEPDEMTSVQRAFLQNYVNGLETALYGADFRDPARGYAAYLDVDSSIDYHLLVEVTKNVDGFRFSTFFHKERGGKIKMGPLWDWNLSFGNCNGKQGYMPEWWLWPQLDDKEYSWFRRLFEDPEFAQRYVDRWTELRRGVFATSNVLARVDRTAALLAEAQARNFQKWPILGQAVNPNWFVADTYAEEVEWMKKWIASRLDWMEKQFPAPPSVEQESSGALLLKVEGGRAGKVYYTLDGSDPRAAGGEVSTQAKVYETPLAAGSGKLVARTLDGKRWSGPVGIGR